LEEVILDLSLTEMFAVNVDCQGALFSTSLESLSTTTLSSLHIIDQSAGEVNLVNSISPNEPNIEFTGLAFFKNYEAIFDCDNEVRLNIVSPQKSTVKAKKSIFSNATIKMSTTYLAEESVELNDYFCVPTNQNLNIIINEVCP